ncbi:unnamed protein product [Triticum turgidum subsp. durum]|uniref:Uncharacterized protein n=1 Tax=Triticum turgidum subsp. durum TaxID=4567 RepID=A0A9R1RU34_TRITD|nr:unnamed protein product [Triticum turgidum subsp. durum]
MQVTCQLIGIVFEEKTPEELQNHATVKPSVVELLLEISKYCDFYLMETVLDDKSEENALMALEKAGLFNTGGLMKEKVTSLHQTTLLIKLIYLFPVSHVPLLHHFSVAVNHVNIYG